MLLVLILSIPLMLLCALFSTLAKHSRPKPKGAQKPTIAVVGAGIAGCGCAWSLARAGYKVEVFESQSHVGGNAKTFDWPPLESGGKVIRTGLSVLAWPKILFITYNKLMAELGIKCEAVRLALRIVDENHNLIFEHGNLTQGHPKTLKTDFARFEKMCAFVWAVTKLFNKRQRFSLYNMSVLNPLNYVSIYVLTKVFFISEKFWDEVFVPAYATAVLSVHQKSLPASMLTALVRVMPLSSVCEMDSWSNNSSEVFTLLTKDVKMNTECPVVSVRLYNKNEEQKVTVTTATGITKTFDRVVFACDATTALKTLTAGTNSRLHKFILSQVTYTDWHDNSFVKGYIHSDPTAVGIPAQVRDTVLSTNCNYIRLIKRPDRTIQYDNTFVVSSWLPCLKATKLSQRRPMFVSYNPANPPKEALGTVQNVQNHTDLSTNNQTIMLLVRMLQGRGGAYFCGAYTVPGNAHDLSLLSGLVVASVLGAPFPFASDVLCQQDFEDVSWLMGLTGKVC